MGPDRSSSIGWQKVARRLMRASAVTMPQLYDCIHHSRPKKTTANFSFASYGGCIRTKTIFR
jgi:hypothetical protein